MSAESTILPERFARLPTWLMQQFQSSAATITRIEKLSGGAIQENWLLDCKLDGQCNRWVLRTDSVSTLSTSHTRAEEFLILQAVFATGVCAPEPIALCTDSSVLGAPFYLMMRAAGVAQANRVVRDKALATYGDSLAASLGSQLARIHAIEPGAESLDFLQRPDGHPAQHRIDCYRIDLDALPDAHPVLEYLLVWLEDQQPDSYSVTLCHTDFRTGNYLVNDGQLTAILDWEFASISDPAEDVGWFSARCWRFSNPQLEAGGIATLDVFCDGYNSISTKPLDRSVVGYWQVMAEVRWAVIALQQANRHQSGQEVSLELALTGLMANEMEHNALSLIQRLDGDVA